MKTTKSYGLDPNVLYDKYKEQTEKLYKDGLVIIKSNETINRVIDENLKDNIFTYNVFKVSKNKDTKYKVERTQNIHGCSGEFLKYLGFSLDEASETFFNKGFPSLYNDIE